MKLFFSSLTVAALGLFLGIVQVSTSPTLHLHIPIKGMKAEVGRCQVEILSPQDSIIGSASRLVYVNKDDYTLPIRVKLIKEVDDHDLLRVRVTFKNSEQVYSLFQLQDRMVVKILGQKEFIKGTPINYRIIVSNQRTNEPISRAKIRVRLGPKENPQTLFEAETDNSGTCNAKFNVPEQINQGDLHFEIVSAIGKDTYTTPFKLVGGTLTYLVTDKPIYQPGQTIHIRTLSLQKPGLGAVQNNELILEVEDSKGNKVFKKILKTDEFGVGYSPFLLADEVNFGNWTIRAMLGTERVEKTVKVEKYILPKFKIGLKTDKEFYLPGEKMEADIDVQYFFDKPVAGGKVKVSVYKFDIGFNKEAVIEGKTDNNGRYHFSYELPDYFVGEPLEKGQAFVRLDIEVIDKANHSEKISVTKKIVQDMISLSIVPEGGVLKPNLENRLYVLANYPDHTPCQCQIELDIDGKKSSAKTDEFGIAEFLYTPKAPRTEMVVTAKDLKGETAELKKGFGLDIDQDQIIMRMRRGIYQVGQSIELDFLSTKKRGQVYLDIIKDNQTVLTKSIAITDGKGTYQLNLGPELSGSIWLHAYIVTPGGNIVRDTRFCYVHPANDLRIDVQPDKDEYLPGQNGTILFTVTDKNDKPRVAALCIAIVDEAVFAVSELQPGLEKVYFTLEKEILEPRYEIHGFKPAEIVKRPQIQARAENVIFSTLVPKEPFPVNYTTLDEFNDKIKATFYPNLIQASDKIYAAINKYYAKYKSYPRTAKGLDTLFAEGFLKDKDLIDPWSRRYRITFPKDEEFISYFTITCAGPDGIFGNDDDMRDLPWMRFDWFVNADPEVQRMIQPEEAVPGPRPRAEALKGITGIEKTVAPPKPGPGEEPRVREYFPETFIFEPALITDINGKANLPVSMPDAITTWRLSSFASSQNGDLGSTLSQIRVFQDFFVDIDLPVALTQQDEISIPIALYNYLPRKQQIRVVLQPEDWFEIIKEAEITKTLAKDEVSVVYFPIKVKRLGYHSILVKAYGELKSDAIKREIAVLPDGKKFEEIISDRLVGKVVKKITFPENGIPGANTLILKLYPGIYSQVVEGLDKMLGMPFGCFEQTSSVTYPNILILNYLRQTEQIKPETEMRAGQYISIGYQRLLSFEVKGGGFSWFGDAPANRILTAYGLMQFNDMSKVYEIDQKVIERTANWLKDQQNPDGSWSVDREYLHAEAWGRIQKNEILATAYILWALGEIGDKGEATMRALSYLKKNWHSVQDPYILALIANAFVAVEPKAQTTMEVLERLIEKAKKENGVIYWESDIPSVTFTRGKGADIEATGLAAYALIRSGKFVDTVNKVLTYLIRAKDSNGMWYTTQGTIISLRSMVAALGGISEEPDASIIVRMNDKEIGQLKIDKDNADVMHQLDLTDGLKNENSVELELQGKGNLLYELTSGYYIPWKDLAPAPAPLFAIDVQYDRTKLRINDLVEVAVSIRLSKPGTAQMVMIDLGIPPGFEVQTPSLDEHVGKRIQKYTLTPRQIIIYLESVRSDKPVEFSYTLKAKYPIKAQVRASRVYEYYNTQDQAVEEPFKIEVVF